MLWICTWSSCLVKKQDFSKHIFWHLYPPRCKNPCEELSRHSGFVILLIKKPQTNNPAMKASPCSIPYCTHVTCFKMMVRSSFDPFRNSWEGEKRKKKPHPFCGAFCGSSGISTEWSFGINCFFKRHSCHYEWSSNSEGRVASQTR